MIVLSEFSDTLASSPSAQDLKRMTETARLSGGSIYFLPQDFLSYEDPAHAFSSIPEQKEEKFAVWIGYIPSREHYQAVYTFLQQKRICLLNTPEKHRQIQEFDQAYPFLQEWTPQSVIFEDISQCESAIDSLGFPIFVKGTIQSRKADGWNACVAKNKEELQTIVQAYLNRPLRSRGKVVLRKIVKLRASRTSPQGFPLGREYRVFLYQNQILGLGYYWEGEDPLKKLSSQEKMEVSSLALEASKRFGGPYLTVDIGQSENGEWLIIETGDAQFSGICQVSLWQLWNALAEKMS